jgi:hypothetical protein
MNLTDINDLYECWVFCKILYSITQRYEITFKEIHSSKGVADFRASDRSFHLVYQAHYIIHWKDQDRDIEDVPDIAIEFNNGMKFIIDAKNSHHTLSDSRPNLDQMRSYMTSLNAKYGVFIHSESEDLNLRKGIENKKNNQTIIYFFEYNKQN